MAVNRARALRVAWMGGPTPPPPATSQASRGRSRPASGTAQPTDEAPPAPPPTEATFEPAPEVPKTFEDALQPGDLPPAPEQTGPRIVRVMLVEDVAEVTHHIRDLLRTQPRFRLVHVADDGRKAVDEVADIDPDVVIVDSLLQGRADSREVVKGLRAKARRPVGVVAISVPDHPLDKELEAQADAVVAMPFSQVQLARGIGDAFTALMARDPSATSRIVTVFSPKGGVGTTTLALNVAVSLAETGLRTALVDGSLQFAGVRRLLLAGADAPSIMDLPTFELRETDVLDTVVRVAGVDILLGPPRPEMSELIARRDVDQAIEVLRRCYQAIVIDTASTLGDATLAFLDAADVILGVVTPEPAAIDAMRAMTDTFIEMAIPESKVRLVVNDRDRPGALGAREVAGMLGREPAYAVASDPAVVTGCNAQGAPFVQVRPDAPASRDVRAMSDSLRAAVVANGATGSVSKIPWRR